MFFVHSPSLIRTQCIYYIYLPIWILNVLLQTDILPEHLFHLSSLEDDFSCETGRGAAQLSLDRLSHLKLPTLRASTEPARTWWSVNVCCEASALNSEIHFRSTRLRSVQKRQYSGLQGFSPAGSALTLLRDLYLPAGVQQVTAVFLFLEKKKCLNLFFSPRRREHMSTWLTHFLLNEGLWPAAQVMKHRARF